MIVKDLIGKRFSKLLIVEFDEKRSASTGRKYWICLCDCGNKKSIGEANVLSGMVKSCGCLKAIDYSGQRFGKLLVIKRDITKHERDVYWLCQCDCGNIVSVKAKAIIRIESRRPIKYDLRKKLEQHHQNPRVPAISAMIRKRRV